MKKLLFILTILILPTFSISSTTVLPIDKINCKHLETIKNDSSKNIYPFYNLSTKEKKQNYNSMTANRILGELYFYGNNIRNIGIGKDNTYNCIVDIRYYLAVYYLENYITEKKIYIKQYNNKFRKFLKLFNINMSSFKKSNRYKNFTNYIHILDFEIENSVYRLLAEAAFNEKKYEVAFKYYNILENTDYILKFDKHDTHLGYMYYYGLGTEQNNQKAYKFLNKASNFGNPQAQFLLGKIYFYGKGIQKDKELAKYWLSKAQHKTEHKIYELKKYFKHCAGKKNCKESLRSSRFHLSQYQDLLYYINEFYDEEY